MLIFTGFETAMVRFERKKHQKNFKARPGFDLGTFGLQNKGSTTELLIHYGINL